MKGKKGRDKLSIVLGFAVSLSAILGVLVFFLTGGGESIMEYIFMGLVVVLVIGASVLIVKKTSNVRAGLPGEDELSKRISWRAGAYSYYTTMWLAIALMWYNLLIAGILGLPQLDTFGIVGAIILIPGIVFVGLSLYFGRKGNI